jgi:hypothetical protein
MRGSSDSNGNAVECTECDPPRRFKNRAGLNGHTQFKHGHLPDNRAVMPKGKQSQMYEDLTALVDQGLNQVLDRQDEILAHLQNGNGNGNGQVNGNGNGQGNGNGNGQVNGNGYNTEPIGIDSPPKDEPKDEPNYYCEDCDSRDLTLGQPYCGGCGQAIDWNGHDVPLDLDKSGV